MRFSKQNVGRITCICSGLPGLTGNIGIQSSFVKEMQSLSFLKSFTTAIKDDLRMEEEDSNLSSSDSDVNKF